MNLKRLILERIENRVLVGTTMFLGIMVLVGWVAINEPGRMAAFQQEHLARSIEKGAELFTNNCAECHGGNGLGSGRAPGLNNPQLFGIDFFAPIDSAIADLETAQADIAQLHATLDGDTSSMTADEKAGLEAQLAAYTDQYGQDPAAAIQEQIASKQAERQALQTQMQGAVDKGYNPDQPSRLGIVGWNGTLDAFVHTTLIAGRPVSSSYWPQPMPAWSQTAGGPLRDDQLGDLTNYVLNWGANRAWTLEDLLAVNQFAKIPAEGGAAAVEGVAPEIINIQFADVTDRRADIDASVQRVLGELESVTGDPNNGQTLYNGALACSSCHSNASIAPPTEGTFTRINDTRLKDPALAGYTPEHYLVESILIPNAYISPSTYPANAMPQNFGERLDLQMLADLIAYLKSHDEPDPLAAN
ncbi:MAG: cytochrome c [Anaerolineae bacterium]|nr:cytochrome c [Anaerolineae bacterium]